MTVDIPIPRMKAEDRRELILEAATAVFGDLGYVGTTTDQVARAAGVSQPYVVRLFGGKERLFLGVLERALARLLDVFRAVLANDDHDDRELSSRLGRAYIDLLRDRGLLLSLMQSFVMGSDPIIGPTARRGFLDVYTFLREEAGFGAEQAHAFLQGGMLINTLVGLRLSEDFETDERVHELLSTAAPDKLDVMLELGRTQRPDDR